jgi:signal transduction histidine kinase
MKLLHKGLILISVPLAFEVFFVSGFGSLLQRSMRLLQAEVVAKDIIAQTDKIEAEVTESSFIVGVRRLSPGAKVQQRFNLIWNNISNSFDRLVKVADGHVEPERLAAIQDELQKAHRMQLILWHFMPFGEHGLDTAAQRQSAAAKGLMLFRVHKMSRSSTPLSELITSELNSVKQGPQLREDIAGQFKSFLVFGIVAEIAIVTALALYFSRNIAGRLRSLMETTNRLARGKELAPALAGDDELAQLDSMLHDTAARLIEVQAFKKQLIGVVCHELKAPLSAVQIMLSSTLDQASELGEKATFSIERTLRSCNRLQLMVSDLLDLEVMGSGKVQLSSAEHNCAEIANSAVDMVKVFAADNLIELTIVGGDFPARFDGSRIIQVLVNLLSNAIKFAPQSSAVTINIDCDDDAVTFNVTDNGPGVPARLRESIFDAFGHSEGANKTRVKGTGLGLAISKTIVTAHGGMITVLDTAAGNTFSVSLPKNAATSAVVIETDKSNEVDPSKARSHAERRSVSIRQKGLILIGVPFVTELVLVGALAFALNQASQEIEQQARGREVAWTAEKVVEAMGDESVVALIGRGSPDYDRYMAEERSALQTRLNSLLSLCSNDTQREPIAKAMQVAIQDIQAQHDDLARRSKVNFLTIHNAETKMLDDYLAQWKNVSDEATALAEHEEALKSANNNALSAIAANLDNMLFLGLIANFVIAGGLTVFMVRGITRRIANVEKNAERLLNKEPLAEALHGSDEVAYLDKAFHDAADALEEERKLKQRLMAIASHELRTPLTSILSNLELLTSGAYGELPEKATEKIHSAQQGTERLITLINDILDIEKMEAGSFVLQRSPVAPGEFVARAIACVQALADERGVALRTQSEKQLDGGVDEGTLVQADSERIVQVLVNLLTNAIKFSKSGQTVMVTLSLSTDGQLITTVADSGSGIPDALQDRIFERFITCDDAAGGNAAGSGLGLPISKAIVEQHGGAIGFESSPDRGSRFWFSLPLADVPAAVSL